MHQPRREHVAEVQACSQAAVRHSAQAASDLPRRVHVASALQGRPVLSHRRAHRRDIYAQLTIFNFLID